MILGEATSSIDARTEAIVQRGMDRLMEGRTTFVIAHRLSTARNSDVNIVLDHGRVIERGPTTTSSLGGATTPSSTSVALSWSRAPRLFRVGYFIVRRPIPL